MFIIKQFQQHAAIKQWQKQWQAEYECKMAEARDGQKQLLHKHVRELRIQEQEGAVLQLQLQQARENNEKLLEELRASCATEEKFDALIKLAQERTPSPDIASKHITSEALTGQA